MWSAAEEKARKRKLDNYLAITSLLGIRRDVFRSEDHILGMKLKSRCLLPTCTEYTEHRGGYCCAEHCAEHRAMAKDSRSTTTSAKRKRR